MRSLRELTWPLWAAGAALAGAACLCLPGVRQPDRPAETSLDLSPSEIARTAERLEATRQAILACREAKLAVGRAVVRGELTLLDAAARFRELSALSPVATAIARRLDGAGTPEELFYARSVIAYVEGLLYRSPCEAAAEVARLEAELQDHLDGGTLRFPGP